MGILTDDMKRIVAEQGLGFVGSVGADGWPGVSPKGTMLTLGDDRIAFADIRSPVTVHNIAHNPRIEISFVDPFARKGYRFRGTATVHAKDSEGFKRLAATFEKQWPSLYPRMRHLVELAVERALPLSTPPYDTGTTEAELRGYWTERYRKMQPGGDFPAPGAGAWKA